MRAAPAPTCGSRRSPPARPPPHLHGRPPAQGLPPRSGAAGRGAAGLGRGAAPARPSRLPWDRRLRPGGEGRREGGLEGGGRRTPFPFLFRWAAARPSPLGCARYGGGPGGAVGAGEEGEESGERRGEHGRRPLPPAGPPWHWGGGEGSSPPRGPCRGLRAAGCAGWGGRGAAAGRPSGPRHLSPRRPATESRRRPERRARSCRRVNNKPGGPCQVHGDTCPPGHRPRWRAARLTHHSLSARVLQVGK